jgi:hypothetical protein
VSNHLVTIRTRTMAEPRQIYSSSLSRRDRAWRRARRRPSSVIGPLLARLAAAAVLTTTIALLLLPRLG